MASTSGQSTVAPLSLSQPPNKRRKTEFYVPEDVIENILSFLPVKQLCRVSVLSKRFTDSSKLCRNLNFDRTFSRNLTRDQYRSTVTNFFSNHLNTCIDTFKMYYDATADTDLVSLWIDRAVSLGVKELELDFSPSRKQFMLDYKPIDVERIKTINLVNCELHLQLDSNGLSHLREITFQNVRAWPLTIESTFVNCVSLRALKLIRCNYVLSLEASAQSLRTLVVKDCSDVRSIAINAPLLRTFHYHGKITEFKFYCNLPYLSDVILDLAPPRSFQVLSRRMDLLNSLASVETLTVSSTFLEGLAARYEDNEYKDVEFVLGNLKEFHLLVASESFINPSDVIMFLRKCPSVERVFIDLGRYAFADSIYWQNYGRNYMNDCQIILPSLKYVKIKGFTAKELPVSMAKFFLKNAIYLRCLVLVKAKIHHCPEFYSAESLRWDVISNAQIEIYDYHKDKSTVFPEHLRGV